MVGKNGLQLIFSLKLIFSLSVSFCGHSLQAQSNYPLEQGEKWTPEDDSITQKILIETKNLATSNRPQGGPLRRDAHPKHHGCVKAFWTTSRSTLPEDKQIGVFKKSNEPISAWIRFSNGAPEGAKKPDSDADIRGFAIKLMNVPNTPKGSQDFLGITSPRFFSRDSQDYLDLFNAVRKGFGGIAFYAISNPTNAYLLNNARVVPTNPLKTDYFMPVPSKIGNQSMRLAFLPCKLNSSEHPNFDHTEHDGLGIALAAGLSTKNACYEIHVQINQDPLKNDIENTTLAWDTRKSPWFLAGQLSIPVQEGVNSKQQMNFCENLSFNPWNSQPEIRPLGRINRIRKIVYENMAEMRSNENKIKQSEPIDHRPCENSITKGLCD